MLDIVSPQNATTNPAVTTTSGNSAYTTLKGGSFLTDALGSGNTYNHNEAIYDWERSEQSAQNARDWSERMSNTAVQRAVSDYEAAGFSPLAVLSGGSASTPQAAVGSSSKASASGNTGKFGANAISAITSLGMIIGASVGSAAKMASATAAAKKNDALAKILERQLAGTSSASAARKYLNHAIKF